MSYFMSNSVLSGSSVLKSAFKTSKAFLEASICAISNGARKKPPNAKVRYDLVKWPSFAINEDSSLRSRSQTVFRISIGNFV